MTEENAKRLYVHFKELIAGKMKTGNAIRDELIVSDATLNLADLVKKRPKIDFEEVTEDTAEDIEYKEGIGKEEEKPKKIKKNSKEE